MELLIKTIQTIMNCKMTDNSMTDLQKMLKTEKTKYFLIKIKHDQLVISDNFSDVKGNYLFITKKCGKIDFFDPLKFIEMKFENSEIKNSSIEGFFNDTRIENTSGFSNCNTDTHKHFSFASLIKNGIKSKTNHSRTFENHKNIKDKNINENNTHDKKSCDKRINDKNINEKNRDKNEFVNHNSDEKSLIENTSIENGEIERNMLLFLRKDIEVSTSLKKMKLFQKELINKDPQKEEEVNERMVIFFKTYLERLWSNVNVFKSNDKKTVEHFIKLKTLLTELKTEKTGKKNTEFIQKAIKRLNSLIVQRSNVIRSI